MAFSNKHIKHSSLLLSVVASLTLGACTTVSPSISQKDATLISPSQTLRAERLDNLLQSAVSQNKVPGLSVLVYEDGKEVYYGQAGLRDRETNIPLARSDVGRYYSMTKPIVGVGLMMLYEEGKFDLDDPIAKYLPEYSNLKVYAGENEDGTLLTTALKRAVTIRDLMRHTAGLTYGRFSDTGVDKEYRKARILHPHDNLETFSTNLGKLPLLVQPGEKWIYSVAVDVQARLIEVLTGKTVGEYLQDSLFTPLGMSHTGFVVKPDDKEKFGPAYIVDKSSGSPVFIRLTDPNAPKITRGVVYQIDGNFLNKQPLESGGGGLVSSIDDYAKFTTMLLQKGTSGGKSYLKPETLALMSSDQLGNIDNGQLDASLGFGLDFSVKLKQIEDPDTLKLPDGSFFWGGLAGTYFWIDPTNDLFAVMHMQFINPLDPYIRNAVVSAVYGN